MRTHITILLTLILLISVAFDSTARTIKDVFVNTPDDVLQLLSQRTRMDMIDYLNDGRMVDVANNLGKPSHLNRATDNYLSLQLTATTEVEMQLVPVSPKDTVIIMVTTVNLPARDSRIRVFGFDWQPRQVEAYVKVPSMKDFVKIPKGDKTRRETVLNAIEFPIISYSINPENNTIIARQGLKDYMSKDDYERIAPYLRDSVTLERKGKVFKIKK